MQRYFETLIDARGNVQAGLSVLVKIGGQNATIYSDDGVTAQANPMTSDSNGGISFYAANGRYDLSLVAASGAVTALRSGIDLFDPAECDLATPTSSSTVVGETGGVVKRFAYYFTPTVASAVARLYDSKLAEIESRADAGGPAKALLKFQAGGSGSDTLVVSPTYNRAKANLSSATIGGGGATADKNLIGYGHNRETFTTTGTAFTWSHLPTDSLSDLRLFKLTANNSISALTSPTDYTAVVNGAQVDITLAVALTSGERLIVEDPYAEVEDAGTAPSYSWIGGGYDNVALTGVMQHITGAHHRIIGGDHGTILGGSYGVIAGGSYGAILGGTTNEIGSGGGNGAVVAGGIRNKVTGATSTIVGGQENKVSASQGATLGGYRLNVSGTASAAAGRNNTISGSDGLIAGNGNTSSGNYSFTLGLEHTVSHHHSHARGGYKASTSWWGQDVRWAYRNTGSALTAFRQHFFIDLSLYTDTTSSALIQLLDGTTSITPRASSVWKCRLQVSARGGNLKGATFEATFSVQRDATTTTLIAAADITSVVDAGMGTAGNAASIAVAIVSDAIEITCQPRVDTAVGTKWAGVLEVLEVA